MTSSFNLSRRPKQKKTLWGSYFRNQGICPPGFATTFVGHQDWKVCTPITEEVPVVPDRPNCPNTDTSGKKMGKQAIGWQDGSANPNKKVWPPPGNSREFSATLYEPNVSPSWMYNQIPYQMRRNLHEPRAYFDRYGYYSTPMNYNGTGYDTIRWWPSEGGKIPQYAGDNVDYPPVWNPFVAAQPYPAQVKAEEGREKKWTTLNSRNAANKAGCFYGQCPSFNEVYNANPRKYK